MMGKLLGLEVIPLNLYYQDWIFKDDVHKISSCINNLTLDHNEFEIDYRIIAHDGKIIHVVEKGNCIFTDDNKPDHIQSVILDISFVNNDNSDFYSPLELNRKLLSQVLESTTIPKFIIDTNHRVFYWNQPCERLTGVSANDMLGTKGHWSLFYGKHRPVLIDLMLKKDPSKDIKEWYGDKIKPSSLMQDAYEGEDFFPRLGENGLWLHFVAMPIKDEQGNIVGAFETIQDMTEHYNNLNQIKLSEERFRYLFENANDIIYTHDLSGLLTSVNPLGVELFGYSYDEIIGMPISQLVDASYLTEARQMLQRKVDGEMTTGPYELLTVSKSGEAIWLEVNSRLLKQDGLPKEIQGIARNITDRKKSEMLLHVLNRASHAMMKQLSKKDIFDHLTTLLLEMGYNTMLFKCDDEGKNAFLDYYGFEDNRLVMVESLLKIDAKKFRLSINDVSMLNKVYYNRKSLFCDNVSAMLKQMLPKKMHLFIPQLIKLMKVNQFIAAPVIVNNAVVGVFCVLSNELFKQDVPAISAFANQMATALNNASLYEKIQQELNDRIKAEKIIEESLTEKEVLLKEIHHRVKNNLQIILSLLNLQSRKLTDKQSLESFQVAKNRVHSLALVHERLYQSQDFVNIDFREYIISVVQHLFYSYEITGKIELDVNVTDIQLDIDNAIPCGLLINELVTNSLKHAFPAGRKGKIQISLKADSFGTKELVVSDDGVGFSLDLDHEKSDTLGMNLIRVLTRQLNGSFDIENVEGTRFVCNFTGV